MTVVPDHVLVANAERIALEEAASVLDPPPPIDYVAWAENNIEFGPDAPFPGPFDRSRLPFLTEILKALAPEDPCRIVTVRKSAQIGGTIVGTIFAVGSVDLDPGLFLFVHPTEDNGARWSRTKLTPFLRSTSSLSRLFPERSRDGANAVLYKERRDGRGAILVSGANSPASLSQITVKRQVQDDLAKWDTNAAGDPEKQADSRSRAHEFAKILKISTPMVLPGCRITRDFMAGSQEYFYVPCPHCEHMQILEWENFKASIDPERPEDAHFICPACGCEIREHHRPAMLARMEVRAHNPKAKRYHRSFHVWSAYAHGLQSFEQIARNWLSAQGDPESERVFANDDVGDAYEVQGESPPWEEIRNRAADSDYVRGTIPAWGLLVTIGIDCQGDRVEWQAVAWGRDYRRAVIDAGVYQGHISDPEPQKLLGALMDQPWRHASGNTIVADLTAIDGNAYTEEVWEWVRTKPASKLIMVRGDKNESAPLLRQVKKERNRRGKLVRYSKRFYNFNGAVLKQALYRNLKKTDPEERSFVALPRGLDDDYFQQLCAERRVEKKGKDGFSKYQWEKDSGQPNEMLDNHLQAEAAAIRLGVRALPESVWASYEAERALPQPGAQLDLEDAMRPATVPAPAKEPKPAAPNASLANLSDVYS